MERSCDDLLFGSLSGNSYVREKSYEGLAVVSRISWHVGGHVRSESNLYRGIEKASRRHVEALLCFWPLVFQYLDPEDLVVWRLYA